MKTIPEFLSENFQFLVVKFSIYLNRCVFVMIFSSSLKDSLLVQIPMSGTRTSVQYTFINMSALRDGTKSVLS